MNRGVMKFISSGKNDVLLLAVLLLVCLLIFFPIFNTSYAYTDDYVGIWQFNEPGSSHTLLQYGRVVTEKLAEWLFGSIDNINDLRLIRLFSLAGWLLSIPIWYYIIKRIVSRENLPEEMVFFSTLYLICLPTVAISIGWAACFELFIANTLGILSGYLLYRGISYKDGLVRVSSLYFIASTLTGIICLFTYQTGFGCFLLPFILQFIAKSKLTRTVFIALGAYFFICLLYYLLYKYSLRVNHIGISERTALHFNVVNKALFFLGRPLSNAFHFTFLFNEKSFLGTIVYGIILGCWLFLSFLQKKQFKKLSILKYFITVFFLLGLVYLPLLVIKENYSSNRTMLGLKMAVFFFVAFTLLQSSRYNYKAKYAIICILSVLFIVNARYNFNKQFLQPIAHEYKAIKYYFESNYQSGIDTVFFFRPHEDFFVNKYGIARSWDEFGVPSTYPRWTSEFLFKQVILEKTGNRKLAEKLVVENSFEKNSIPLTDTIPRHNVMLIDAEKIINAY